MFRGKDIKALKRASPAVEQTNPPPDLKRKRPEPGDIWSQPTNTGMGTDLGTNVKYVQDYLQSKRTPHSLDDILGYLSLQYSDTGKKNNIATVLQAHPKIKYDPKANNGKGAYSFQPAYDIETPAQLLAALQAQRTAQGLEVKELKEGWPKVETAIDELERAHKLLVTRNKKDNSPKKVWADDPSLRQDVDEEFKGMWHRIRLLDPQSTIDYLEMNSLTPTNKSAPTVAAPKVVKKKPKKSRMSTKMTNTHMMPVLRDFSHKRLG